MAGIIWIRNYLVPSIDKLSSAFLCTYDFKFYHLIIEVLKKWQKMRACAGLGLNNSYQKWMNIDSLVWLKQFDSMCGYVMDIPLINTVNLAKFHTIQEILNAFNTKKLWFYSLVYVPGHSRLSKNWLLF